MAKSTRRNWMFNGLFVGTLMLAEWLAIGTGRGATIEQQLVDSSQWTHDERCATGRLCCFRWWWWWPWWWSFFVVVCSLLMSIEVGRR